MIERMLDGRASGTAQRVALARAAHQVLDAPIILADPLAASVLDPSDAALLRQHPEQQNESPVARFTRAIVVVRSRIAEDEIARAAGRGVTQYVLLGAGLDTFGYRNPLPDVRVFEVDHPATQRLKRERLTAAGISSTDRVTFVSCDFSRDMLEAVLPQHGFDPSRPAVFAWLGVVMYLEPDDVTRTLRYLGGLAPGTTLVFDYALPPRALPWVPRFYYQRLLDRLAQQGEPWTVFFEPDEIRADLMNAGFTQVEDLGGEDINARYLNDRSDGLRAGTVGHVVIARRQIPDAAAKRD